MAQKIAYDFRYIYISAALRAVGEQFVSSLRLKEVGEQRHAQCWWSWSDTCKWSDPQTADVVAVVRQDSLTRRIGNAHCMTKNVIYLKLSV